MAWPTVSLAIGTASASDAFVLDDATQGKLDTGGELGDSLGYVWADISATMRATDGLTINRGSTRNQGPYFRYEAGSLTVSLDNRDGDLDLFNLSGTHVSAGVTQLRPGLPIRAQAAYNGTTWTLFVGYVSEWTVTYPQAGIDSVVQVVATDAVGVLNDADGLAQPSQGGGENVGTRVGRILDNIGWDGSAREIDTATLDTLKDTQLAQAAWAEMLVTSDSVNGYLFVDCDGSVVWQPKNQFPRAADMDVGIGGISTATVEVSNDATQLYNVVKLARAEGVEQGGRDETSIALYGLRGYSRSDLVVNTESQVQSSMGYILSQYRDMVLRVEGFTIRPTDSWSNDHWQKLFETDMTRRISAVFTTTDGRTITREGLVRGLTLSVHPMQWSWNISTTQAPEALGTFTLDHAALGLLDTGTLAAF